MGLHNSDSHRTDLVPKDKEYLKDRYLGATKVWNNLGKTPETTNHKPKRPRHSDGSLWKWFLSPLIEHVGFSLQDPGKAIHGLFITTA
jgi:hypothetical protein